MYNIQLFLMYDKINQIFFMSFNINSIQNNPLKKLIAIFLVTVLTPSLCNVSTLFLMKN